VIAEHLVTHWFWHQKTSFLHNTNHRSNRKRAFTYVLYTYILLIKRNENLINLTKLIKDFLIKGWRLWGLNKLSKKLQDTCTTARRRGSIESLYRISFWCYYYKMSFMQRAQSLSCLLAVYMYVILSGCSLRSCGANRTWATCCWVHSRHLPATIFTRFLFCQLKITHCYRVISV